MSSELRCLRRRQIGGSPAEGLSKRMSDLVFSLGRDGMRCGERVWPGSKPETKNHGEPAGHEDPADLERKEEGSSAMP